jgi:hypothetical protein
MLAAFTPIVFQMITQLKDTDVRVNLASLVMVLIAET